MCKISRLNIHTNGVKRSNLLISTSRNDTKVHILNWSWSFGIMSLYASIAIGCEFEWIKSDYCELVNKIVCCFGYQWYVVSLQVALCHFNERRNQINFIFKSIHLWKRTNLIEFIELTECLDSMCQKIKARLLHTHFVKLRAIIIMMIIILIFF